MTLCNLTRVANLCHEVETLASEVRRINDELDKATKAAGADHDAWIRAYREHPPAAPKLTGELRRRSMDLTRALADLRRS